MPLCVLSSLILRVPNILYFSSCRGLSVVIPNTYHALSCFTPLHLLSPGMCSSDCLLWFFSFHSSGLSLILQPICVSCGLGALHSLLYILQAWYLLQVHKCQPLKQVGRGKKGVRWLCQSNKCILGNFHECIFQNYEK